VLSNSPSVYCAASGIAISLRDGRACGALVTALTRRLGRRRTEWRGARSAAQRIADYLLAFHPAYAARVQQPHASEPDSDAAEPGIQLAEAA